MLRKEWLHRVYLQCAMLVIALCGCFAMLSNDGDDEVSNIILIYFGTAIALFPGFIIYYCQTRVTRRSPTPMTWLTILFAWMLIITMLFGLKSGLKHVIYSALRVFLSWGILCTTYDYAGRYGINRHICWTAVGVQVILLIQYFLIYSTANLFDEAHLITSYYPLFILPLVLIHPSKLIKYASIIIIIIAVFASFKRGGLIALVMGLLVYIFCSRHNQAKGIKSLLYITLAIALLSSIFIFIAMSEYGGVIERIMSISDDGGSGRIDVWATTWEMIAGSDLIRFGIGHGFNAVLLDSPIELSAHNDLLEAWYDFGIIGLLLYVASLISLFRYTKHLIRKKSPIAPSFAMMLTIMVILTLISHVLIYYFMALCSMTLGLLMGQQRYNEHHQ